MSARTAGLSMLPSDEWLLIPLHWHAYTQSPTPDGVPETALHDPSAVATWIAERSAAHLWPVHYLIASRGDSIRHDALTVTAVLNEKCAHGCIGEYLTSGNRP